MKIKEFLNLLEEFAPLKLSSDFVKLTNGYDNSGIIVDLKEDITGVAFSSDLTTKAVESAIEKGYNLIVTHHPAIYAPISNISADSAIYKAISNKIGVISFHLNLDCAKEGIDFCLANGLGAQRQNIMINLGDCEGYGRFFSVKEQTFKNFVENFKKEFNSDRVIAYGTQEDKISKVASFCGSGLDEQTILNCKNVDVIISSDVKHHLILLANSLNKKLMIITHYASEFYGFKHFYKKITSKLNLDTTLVEEEYYF